MKKNEKKVIFGTIPATAATETAMQTEAVAAEQYEAQDPAPGTEQEPVAQDTAAAEESHAGELRPDAAKKQAETVLELSRRIQELEEQLRQEPQSIEERIAYYKRKQALTERYEKYMAQVGHLNELREQVEEVNSDAEDFSNEREKYRLQIFLPHCYRDEAALTITNASLIDCVLDLLRERMLNRAESLQAEISA